MTDATKDKIKDTAVEVKDKAKEKATDFWSSLKSFAGGTLKEKAGNIVDKLKGAATKVSDFIKKKTGKDKDVEKTTNDKTKSDDKSKSDDKLKNGEKPKTDDKSKTNDKSADGLSIDIARAWANPNIIVVTNYLIESSNKIETANRIPDSKASAAQLNLIKNSLVEKYSTDETFMKAFEDPAVQSLINNFSNVDAMSLTDRMELWKGIKSYSEAAAIYVEAYDSNDSAKMNTAEKQYNEGLNAASTIIDKYGNDKASYVTEGTILTEVDMISDIADKAGNASMKKWIDDYIKFNSKSDYNQGKPRSETYEDVTTSSLEDDRQYE